MSTLVSESLKARSLDSRPVSRKDYTWNRSCGISFQASTSTIGKSSQISQISGAEFGYSGFPTPNRFPTAEEASNGEQSSTLGTRNKPARSHVPQNLKSSESSPPEEFPPEDAYHPRFSVSPNTNRVESQNRNESSQSQEGSTRLPSLLDKPFCTPLGFHIPGAKLQDAINAPLSDPSAYWQFRLYQGPGGETDRVKVHYCKNKDDTEKVARLFLEEGQDVIGFDLEWKSNTAATSGIKSNVALVQLASERRVALFHLAQYPNAFVQDDFVAPSFKIIMESPNITKVGVAIKGDCTRLRTHLSIDSRGLFELSHLYKLVKYFDGDVKNINKKLVSLADQVQEHLQLPLWKGEVRGSDWSQSLNHQQTQYAVSDSYAAFHLYHMLEAKRKALVPMPPCPAHAELNLPIRLADGRTVVGVDEASESCETSNISSNISVEELASGLERMDIQQQSRKSPVSPPRYSVAPPRRQAPSERPSDLPFSAEVSLANEWINQYRSSSITQSDTGVSKARPSELRAYALWHEQGLDVPTIAGLLRKPPLQNSTVASYVIKAILNENLPYNTNRTESLKQHVRVYGVPDVTLRNLK